MVGPVQGLLHQMQGLLHQMQGLLHQMQGLLHQMQGLLHQNDEETGGRAGSNSDLSVGFLDDRPALSFHFTLHHPWYAQPSLFLCVTVWQA